MSELKVYHCNEWHNEYTEFYMKSEADKVIAEKDKQIDLYKRGWEENDRINASVYKELRHQKYKRCLAMELYCSAMWHRYMDAEIKERLRNSYCDSKYSNFYSRWRDKWLELAEKFKE